MKKEEKIEVLKMIIENGGCDVYKPHCHDCPLKEGNGETCINFECYRRATSAHHAEIMLKKLEENVMEELKEGFYTDENILVEVSEYSDFSKSKKRYLAVYSTKFSKPYIRTWLGGKTARENSYSIYAISSCSWEYIRLIKEEKPVFSLTKEENGKTTKVVLTPEQLELLGIKQ